MLSSEHGMWTRHAVSLRLVAIDFALQSDFAQHERDFVTFGFVAFVADRAAFAMRFERDARRFEGRTAGRFDDLLHDSVDGRVVVVVDDDAETVARVGVAVVEARDGENVAFDVGFGRNIEARGKKSLHNEAVLALNWRSDIKVESERDALGSRN